MTKRTGSAHDSLMLRRLPRRRAHLAGPLLGGTAATRHPARHYVASQFSIRAKAGSRKLLASEKISHLFWFGELVLMTFSRRQILVGLAGLGVVGLGVGGARYWLGRPQDMASHDYEMIAAPLDVERVAGHKKPAWTYGGQARCLEFRARQGERLRVRFIIHLEVPTSIHWLGIRLPLAMDGVPYVSQLPVLPGEYFDYDFIVHDAGSFWYHPHTASAEQLGRGLVGPLDRKS